MCKVTQYSHLLSQHHNLTHVVTTDTHRTKHAGCRWHYKGSHRNRLSDKNVDTRFTGKIQTGIFWISLLVPCRSVCLSVCVCSAHINLSLSAAIK